MKYQIGEKGKQINNFCADMSSEIIKILGSLQAIIKRKSEKRRKRAEELAAQTKSKIDAKVEAMYQQRIQDRKTVLEGYKQKLFDLKQRTAGNGILRKLIF